MAANSTSNLTGSPPSVAALVHAGGRKLKMASPAAAMEMEIVST